MFKATKAIKAVFDQTRLKCIAEETSELSYVEAGIRGEEYPAMKVRFFSSDDDNDVSVRVMQICKVPESKTAKMLMAVNACNNRFRYVKFVMDKDRDINLEYDIPMSTDKVGEVAREILVRIMKVMEEAYPILMKAMYS